MRPIAAVVSALLLTTGCSVIEPTAVCTAELRTSLEVDVVDAQTLASEAAGSTVILTGATFRDSVTVPDSAPLFSPPIAMLWYEDKVTPGAYSVTVTKPNYQPWSQAGIRVVGDRCHVRGLVQVTATLIPTGT